jgi:hypothetical protein
MSLEVCFRVPDLGDLVGVVGRGPSLLRVMGLLPTT